MDKGARHYHCQPKAEHTAIFLQVPLKAEHLPGRSFAESHGDRKNKKKVAGLCERGGDGQAAGRCGLRRGGLSAVQGPRHHRDILSDRHSVVGADRSERCGRGLCGVATQGDRKEEARQRLIPMDEELTERLAGVCQVAERGSGRRGESVFCAQNPGEQLYRGIVDKIVKRNLSKVATVQKKSPHVLRHTFATQMLNHDAQLGSIKEFAGGTRVWRTTEVYTHTTFEELKRMYNQAHPRA